MPDIPEQRIIYPFFSIAFIIEVGSPSNLNFLLHYTLFTCLMPHYCSGTQMMCW